MTSKVPDHRSHDGDHAVRWTFSSLLRRASLDGGDHVIEPLADGATDTARSLDQLLKFSRAVQGVSDERVHASTNRDEPPGD